MIRGQFDLYRGLPGVDPHSTVETYIALRLSIETWRWAGVPFYIRAGKRMAVTATEVLVELKRPPRDVFGEDATHPTTSSSVWGPTSTSPWGAHEALRRSDGRPGRGARRRSPLAEEASPYQRLLTDAMDGDAELFSRQDVVERSWEIVDPILGDATPVHPYTSGSWGPHEADRLTEGAGGWHNPTCTGRSAGVTRAASPSHITMGGTVHLALQLPSFTFADVSDEQLFERIAEIATAAESAGFDSFWVMDHYHQIANIGPDTDPMLEAYTLLGGVAARTARIQLGAMVTGVTYRNPAFLAKVVTTLDVVSSGRAILGIGAAWNEEESRAYGYPWPPAAERFERLEDALGIRRSMSRSRHRRCRARSTTSMAPWTCPSRSVGAARRSWSAGVASARRSGSPRPTPTCGTGSVTSRRSVTSSTCSRSTARASAVIGPRSSRPASAP